MEPVKKQDRFNSTKRFVQKKILDPYCYIQNGSIQVIKQDKKIIQINVIERIIPE